jgi:hypothetical protein
MFPCLELKIRTSFVTFLVLYPELANQWKPGTQNQNSKCYLSIARKREDKTRNHESHDRPKGLEKMICIHYTLYPP